MTIKKQIKNTFKIDHQAIGDCWYDIYCQPELTTKEDLLKDMAKILNGDLTIDDFKEEIKQWVFERSDQCYLEDGKIKRYDDQSKTDIETAKIIKQLKKTNNKIKRLAGDL